MSPTWKRAALALDVFLLLGVLGLRLWALPAPAPDSPQVSPPLPRLLAPLKGPGDHILHGPDAGDWAIAARRLQRKETPDVRRLPLYPRLTALATGPAGGVVEGGHLVNHLLSLGVVALAFLLGMLTHGRWVAAGAGALVAISPKLLLTQDLFGVDPTLRLGILLLIVTTLIASRRGPAWGMVSGAAAGCVLGTHYLGLLFVLLMAPAQLPLEWRPSEGIKGALKRAPKALLRLALYGAVAFGVFKALMTSYPPVELRDITEEYAVGILSSLDRPDLPSAQWLTPLKLALARLPEALTSLITTLTAPFTLGTSRLGLLWALPMALGLLALPGRGEPWRPHIPLTLTLALVPLLGLLASNAPERYGLYAQPIAFVAALGGLAWVAQALLKPLKRPWLQGLGEAIVVVATFALLFPSLKGAWPGPSPDPGRHQREVGMVVAEAFPGRGSIVTTFQEIRFYADRFSCMHDPCPEGIDALTQCLEAFTASCGGYGDVPYHIQLAGPRGFANQPNPLLEAWVMTVGEEVAVIESLGRRSAIYRVPESAMPAPKGGGGASRGEWTSPTQ